MISKKLSGIVSFFLATLVACLPFNYIVGSKFAWFSCATMAIPALGCQYSLLYVILYIFTKSLCSSTGIMLFLLHRLPLFFATIALRQRSAKIYVGLPCIAMILFCMHSVGSQVFYYSFYWLIPIFIYFFVKDSMYSRALSASFTAHAVGSVILLYRCNLSAQTWTALMFLVPVERLIIAGGMLGCMYVFRYINNFCCHLEPKVIA